LADIPNLLVKFSCVAWFELQSNRNTQSNGKDAAVGVTQTTTQELKGTQITNYGLGQNAENRVISQSKGQVSVLTHLCHVIHG